MRHLFLSFFTFITAFNINAQGVESANLIDINSGKQESLASIIGSKTAIILFADNSCPYVDYYKSRIKKISEKAVNNGVKVIFINPHQEKKPAENSLAQIKSFAQKVNWKGKFYSDPSQEVVALLGAIKLPEAFIIKLSGTQVQKIYAGAIDDNPQNKQAVKSNYVLQALENLLTNNKITNPFISATGCRIKKF